MKLPVELTDQTARQLRQLAQQNNETSLRAARVIGLGLTLLACGLVFLGLQLGRATIRAGR
jgi:hypothetical protein